MASKKYITGMVAALVVAAACSIEDKSDREIERHDALAAGDTSAVAVADAAEVSAPIPQISPAEAQQQISALSDSTDRMLRKVPGLTRWERVKLRRDVNALQISRAKQLGIRPGSNIDQLVRSGTLVTLGDTTQYWALHNLNYSIPVVTPATEALLADIGRRFHARLDSLDVPRYRIVITSALRTSEKQAALRRANSNASRIESAHEYGTTVDIAYRRFAPPADLPPLPADLAVVRDTALVRTANLRSGELQAVLGRVLAELQAEGKVLVMMERRQTVYHITVRQQYPRLPRSASVRLSDSPS